MNKIDINNILRKKEVQKDDKDIIDSYLNNIKKLIDNNETDNALELLNDIDKYVEEIQTLKETYNAKETYIINSCTSLHNELDKKLSLNPKLTFRNNPNNFGYSSTIAILSMISTIICILIIIAVTLPK